MGLSKNSASESLQFGGVVDVGSTLKGGSVFECVDQSTICVGHGVVQQAAPEFSLMAVLRSFVV